MAHVRRATRQTVGSELTPQQVDEVFNRIVNGSHRTSRQETVDAIKQYYAADDVEVAAKRVSLICPILKMRIRNAVRGTLCKHLECFDLRGYLQYHTMMAFWECPFSVCRAKIHCDQLRVDEYFTHVVNTEPDCVSEVDLLKDGSYTVVLPADVVPVTVNDDDPFEPEAKLPTDGGLPAGDPQPELSDPVLDNSNGGPVTELPSNGVTPLSDTVDPVEPPNVAKPFKCTHCHKGFRYRQMQKRHELIHTGVKAFRCRFCNKPFDRTDVLKQHELTHSATKDFA
ncbi:zinc finger protein, partial [Aphelenchoides avenae]